MKKQLTITDEHLKLIPFFFIHENDNEDGVEIYKDTLFNLGSHLMDDMAFILGKVDKAVKGSENDVFGRAFDDDTINHFTSLYEDISSNLFHYENIIHQFSVKGGLTEGVYECDLKDNIWEKVK